LKKRQMKISQRWIARGQQRLCLRVQATVMAVAMMVATVCVATPRVRALGFAAGETASRAVGSGKTLAIRPTKLRRASAGAYQQDGAAAAGHTKSGGSGSGHAKAGSGGSAKSGSGKAKAGTGSKQGVRSTGPADKGTTPAAKSKPHKPESQPVNTRTRLDRADRRGHGEEQMPSGRARRSMHHAGAVALERERAKDADVATETAKPERTLSVDDFVRAAGGQPIAETTAPVAASAVASASDGASAKGVSRPDDDERLPMRHASAGAEVAEAAPEQRSLTNDRVDGFGAEGVPAAPGRANGRERSGLRQAVAPPRLSAAEQEEITDAAVKPVVLPGLYSRTGRLIVPAPLKGSHEILVHQNLMADESGLDRIQDDAMLDHMRAGRQLVAVPETRSLHVNPELPYNRRYARPWAVQFASDVSRQFYLRFHQPLQLNSAVRTVAYQLRLQRVNGNAAPVDGDVASPHLTGQALDFGKRGMSMAQIAWMRAYLMPLISAGKIDVEEEFQQACFHISVYRSYVPQRRQTRMDVAQVQSAPAARRTGGAVKTDAGAPEAEPDR
jgi:Family of unknown function (DUF5715)